MNTKTPTYQNFYFVIKVLDKKREQIIFKKWDKMTFELRMRWDWYFKYRAALFQVQNPRCEVLIYWGNIPNEKTDYEILKNKIKAKKAKITEYNNKLKKSEEHWNMIFPIQEDELYKKAVEKIKRLEFELKILIITIPTK
jgi:hypothetical protein